MEIRVGDRFLHHGFVAALLNDLFGIQGHSGCLCTCAVSTQLLGITNEAMANLEGELMHSDNIIKPGVVRISIGYYWTDDETDFLAKAVMFIADNGWKFLPAYEFSRETCDWKHFTRTTCPPVLVHLSDVHMYDLKPPQMQAPSSPAPIDIASYRSGLFTSATEHMALIVHTAESSASPPTEDFLAQSSLKDTGMQWFLLPSEAVSIVKGDMPLPMRDPSEAKFALFPHLMTSTEAHLSHVLTTQKNGGICCFVCSQMEQRVHSNWM